MSLRRIAIIDYGAGNLRSVQRAVDVAGAGTVEAILTAEPEVVAKAERIILPGQGAFADCMANLLAQPGLVDALEDAVLNAGKPFLGICVGQQLLAERGLEHGDTRGLGWLGGICAPLPPASGVTIPHMGWNAVTPLRPHPVLAGFAPSRHAYFAHSFAFTPADAALTLAETRHGAPFASAVGRDNILGVQFHPEKSQAAGLALLAAFLDWRP